VVGSGGLVGVWWRQLRQVAAAVSAYQRGRLNALSAKRALSSVANVTRAYNKLHGRNSTAYGSEEAKQSHVMMMARVVVVSVCHGAGHARNRENGDKSD
jgi:hypothetical protein